MTLRRLETDSPLDLRILLDGVLQSASLTVWVLIVVFLGVLGTVILTVGVFDPVVRTGIAGVLGSTTREFGVLGGSFAESTSFVVAYGPLPVRVDWTFPGVFS